MAGDQEGQHLIADVEVVEPLPCFGVDRRQHQVEQVFGVGPLSDRKLRAALRDDIVNQCVHRRDVGMELRGRSLGEALLDRQAGDNVQGLAERVTQTQQERIESVALETLEAVAEPRDRDAVEREARHVVGDEHFLPRHSLPFGDELVAHFENQVEIAAHRALAECREQNAVRLAPIGFVAERGEQPVARESAHDAQARPGNFTKARLVAQFGDQIGVRYENADPRAEAQLEDAGVGVIVAQGQQMTDQPRLWNLMKVAEQRQGLRRRNDGGRIGCVAHAGSLPSLSGTA